VLVAAALAACLTRFDGVSGQTVIDVGNPGTGHGTSVQTGTVTTGTTSLGGGSGTLDLHRTWYASPPPQGTSDGSDSSKAEPTAEDLAAAEQRGRDRRDDTARAARELSTFAQQSLNDVAILRKIQRVASQ
jgi:hypothetical protein